ncbi:MAG: hypothetical protein ABSE48_08695 [Verrucomicrobiota bacterium]|jgi:hypothetical protein
MNLLGLIILTVLIFLVLGGSRRTALVGMMAGVLYLTQAQQIEALGFNFYAIRFLELAGFIRVMLRHEFSFRNLNGIDWALLLLYGYTSAVFLLRSSEGVGNQVGMGVDAFLCYFTFRGLVSGMDDFLSFLRTLVILLIPYALLVVIESATGHNPFSVLGGITGGSNWMRHGRPRCFGSFRQPDTLGMFGACFLPLYVALSCIRTERKRAFVGIGLCFVLVLAANCGGAASGAATGLLGWGLWCARKQMWKVRWGLVGLIAALALIMKSPVWYIFARASSITGGDGWTRSYLFDKAYEHLGQWWLAGMPLLDTNSWFPFTLPGIGTADITNMYIWFGLTAGLGAMALFIVLLTRAFSSLGKALAAVRSGPSQSEGAEFLLWGLGVMLLVHIIDWFGIIYFDQMYVTWFMQLAAISGISAGCLGLQSPTVITTELPESVETPRPAEPFQPELSQQS